MRHAVINGLHKDAKKVLQYSLNGEIYKEYFSTKEAGRETNISGSNISRCCRGERKRAGGYMWKYYKQEMSFSTDKQYGVQ